MRIKLGDVECPAGNLKQKLFTHLQILSGLFQKAERGDVILGL